MRGVTQRVYDAFRINHGLKRKSVRGITNIELTEIYRSLYWDRIQGDDLPAGIDYAVFDAAVNSGAVQAAKWLQRSLGSTISVDGVVGPVTIAAARSAARDRAIKSICSQRLAMLKRLKTWNVFGAGWLTRVTAVQASALEMLA